MTKPRHLEERGAITGGTIAIAVLAFAIFILVGLSIWLFVNYRDAKSNIDSKVDAAVADAQRNQATEDENKFAEREKEPNREFVGPDDYGRLTFSYPKTWSTYIDKSIKQGGDFEAYLNPGYVPPVGDSGQRFALRVTIASEDYDKVVDSYQSKVKKGDLKSSPTSANGQNGTRLDGNFSKDIRGAAVIYKIRDKTLIVATDADTFKPDFEKIIQTIKFNQ